MLPTAMCMGFPMKSSSAQPGMPLKLKQLSFSLSISLGLSMRGGFGALGACCAIVVLAANKIIKTKRIRRTEPPSLSWGLGGVGMKKRCGSVNVGADLAFGSQQSVVDGQAGRHLLVMPG